MRFHIRVLGIPLDNTGVPSGSTGVPLRNTGVPLRNTEVPSGSTEVPLRNTGVPPGITKDMMYKKAGYKKPPDITAARQQHCDIRRKI